MNRSRRDLALLSLVLALAGGAASSAQTTQSWQAGGAGAAIDAVNRSCVIRTSTSPTSSTAWVTESGDLALHDVQGYALVDFPFLVGSGPNQVPPGAVIVSARLRLYCTTINGSFFAPRNMVAAPILDPNGLGTWHEPAAPVSQALFSGVNWVRRDSRPGADIPWDLAGSLIPTDGNDPTLIAMFPGIISSVLVDQAPGAPANAFQAGEFHDFDVKTAVQLWTHGIGNQGWIIGNDTAYEVIYAADDHVDATKRPLIEVTWVAGGAPFNRVPETMAPAPVVTEKGVGVSIFLPATDADGPAPTIRLLKQPQNGTIVGNAPFITYQPVPGFSGTDDFTFIARDAYSSSFPRTVTVTVNNTPSTVTRILREGVSPSSNPSVATTEFCAANYTTGSQRTYEDIEVKLASPLGSSSGRMGFLRFPNLFGTGSGQVPPGATILSADLELNAKSISSAGTEPRVITLRRIVDPLDRDLPWHEPTQPAPESTGCIDCGVSFLYPDSRTPANAWLNPGGDLDPTAASNFVIEVGDTNGVTKTADVTAQIQAWADGAPHLGWNLRNSSASTVAFWSESAPLSVDRPRLVVSYRSASAAPVPGPVAPQANAGPDQWALAHQTVVLDASGSHHPLGLPFSGIWIQIGGPPVALAQALSPAPTFVAPAVTAIQELRFLYAAFVNQNSFTVDDVRVLVAPQPGGTSYPSPVTSAGPDFAVTELATATLSGTAQAASGGSIAVSWTKLSGPPLAMTGLNTLTPSFVAPAVGPAGAQVRFDLRVVETIGAVAIARHDQVVVTITNSVNALPIPAPGPNRAAEVGTWVILDGTASYDPDGHDIVLTWSQLSGPAVNLGQYETQGTLAAGITPFFVPQVTQPTPMVFQLLADDAELTATATVTITATPLLPAFAGSLTSNPMGAYRNALTPTEARHLLRRLGLGWSPALVSVARSAGLGAVVSAALSMGGTTPAAVRDEAFNWAEDIAAPWNVDPLPNQPFDLYPELNLTQLESLWFVHAFRSPNTLLERMVRFWHDRLAVSGSGLNGGIRHWGPAHADMIRDHALGNYRDLLLAFARDSLTLRFIDGFDNIAPAPNENFAREFMELHTLGVFNEIGDRIYTDIDVMEAARAFTGWLPSCYAGNPANPASCYPGFVPFFHDSGIKAVLEFSGNYDDEDMVDLVLAHDGGDDAARWLARGLLREFVLDAPPETTVGALAGVILAQNWELQPVLDTLLRSRAMFAPAARKSLVSSPVDSANGLVRTLGIPLQTHNIVSNGSDGLIARYMRSLSHRLGNPEDVSGWPRDLAWMDEFSIILRSEMVRRMLNHARNPDQPYTVEPEADYPGIPAVPVDLAPYLPPLKTRFAAEVVHRVAEYLDIELARVPAPGATLSEFELIVQYMNTVATSPGTPPLGYVATTVPFNANQAGYEDKLWGLVKLLLEHPDANRM